MCIRDRHRTAPRPRFQNDVANAFLPGRTDAQISQFLKTAGVTAPTRPAHPVANTQSIGMAPQRDGQRPVADDDQIDWPVMDPDRNSRKCFQQVIKTLDRVQPAHCDHDQRLIGDSEFMAQWLQRPGRRRNARRYKIADIKNPLRRESMLNQMIVDARTVRHPGMSLSLIHI